MLDLFELLIVLVASPSLGGRCLNFSRGPTLGVHGSVDLSNNFSEGERYILIRTHRIAPISTFLDELRLCV